MGLPTRRCPTPHHRGRRRGPARAWPALALTVTLVGFVGCGRSSPDGAPSPSSTTSTASSATATSVTGTSVTGSSAAATTTTTTTSATSAPPTTTAAGEAAAARASWPTFEGTAVPGRQRSGVELSPAGIFGAVSYDVTGQGVTPHVVIARFVGSAWSIQADLALDLGGVVQQDTPITATHLTGATTPDFVVTVDYNSGDALAIASETGGHWHLLRFTGGPGRPAGGVDEVIDATITGQAITSSSNTCNPDCASGQQVTTTYSFSAATGTMRAVG